MHITEISFKFLFALHSAIFNIADLVTVEAFPSFTVKPLEKINYEDAINEVDKRVPHVALILKINRQIEEIILAFLFSIKAL
jgi:hypothetical protein